MSELIVERDVSPDGLALAERLLAQLPRSYTGTFIDRASAARAIAAAFEHGERFGRAEANGERACRVCGCSEFDPCHPEPCVWVAIDLCSACEPFVEGVSK